MRKLLLFFLPVSLFATLELQSQSMLCKADWIARTFHYETAKAPPPLSAPQTQNCLNAASVWFSIQLEDLKGEAFKMLNTEALWNDLKAIGVEGVHLKGLKARSSIEVDPKWGDWSSLSSILQKKGLALIGDSLSSSTGIGPDFCLALKNVGDYPGLYRLVEIDQSDWSLLPRVRPSELSSNIPWLALQDLHKKGYVPEEFSAYVKQTNWNATGEIKCADGKVRRWIYLKENQADPVIDWLNPTFAGCRIAAADALDSIYNLGAKIIYIDAAMSDNAKETLSLWARKLGAFSAAGNQRGLDEMKTSGADLIADTITRPALLHALIAQDAGALKLMYRLFLSEGIETKKLIHVLQPFDQFTCDWSELIAHPRRKYHYYEEILTGEALRIRLLQQSVSQIGETFPSTWPKYCADALGFKDANQYRDDITIAHLLLAFFYAMQPGVFSFSASDLLGTLSKEPIDLLGTNENALYASLPGQFHNANSFAMRLRKILTIRRENNLASAELIDVPETHQPSLLILLYRQGLLAVNFGQQTALQTLDIPALRNATAIDLMTGLAEKKTLESSTLQINVPALSGKLIRFQPKYYD